MTSRTVIEIPAAAHKESVAPKGRVITFYSYKGGTGRSMALANVAWLLAMGGSRVLVIDWDLEAPGLHRYFHPFLEDKELLNTPGLLDYVETLAAQSAISKEPISEETVDVINYIQKLEWPNGAGLDIRWKQFKPNGQIDILTAGRQGPAYARKLAKFHWIDFYERLHGRVLLGAAKERWKKLYDYVLIDSRTGVSDTSGICTQEMPDTVVICFTLNQQSIVGAAAIARSVAEFRKAEETGEGRRVRILPVPTRVEVTSERDKLRIGLETARKTFAPYFELPPGVSESQYWGRIQMAYFPFYAFEEIPAVFGDSPNQLLSLSTSIKQLTNFITNGEYVHDPTLAEDEHDSERARQTIVGWYLRRPTVRDTDAVALAQEILERVPDKRQSAALSALTRLVQFGERGTLTPKSASLRDLGEISGLLSSFEQAKVLTVTESGGTRTVAFSDPTVVERWETLRRWIDANRQFLVLRQALVAAIEAWKLSERDDEQLLKGRLLTDIKGQASFRAEELNDAEHEFIQLSARATAKAPKPIESKPPGWSLFGISWVRWATASAAVVLALGLSTAGWIYQNRRKAERQARANTILEALKTKSASDPLTTILLLLELGDGEQSSVFREMAADLARTQQFPQQVLNTRGTHAVQLNRDGTLLAVVADSGAQVHDLRSRTVRNVPSHRSAVVAAAFNGWYPRLLDKDPNKSTDRIATLSDDDQVRIWDLRLVSNSSPLVIIDASAGCSATPGYLSGRNAVPVEVRFSPDERTIVVRYDNERIALFNAESGTCVRTPVPLDAQHSVLSPAGGVMALWFDNERLERFRFDGEQLVESVTTTPRLSSRGVLGINCSGDRLVVDPQEEPYQAVLNPISGKKVIFEDDFTVDLVAFDCKNKVVVSASGADRALLYNIEGPPPGAVTFDHKNITALAVDADGTRLVTASPDSVRVWSLNRELPPENASWGDLVAYFRANTHACLTADERKDYLKEELIVAATHASDCASALNRPGSR